MSKSWGKGYKINKFLAEIPDENKLTWLHRTCLLEDLATVQELLDAEVNVNAQDDYGDTPLHYAAYAENLEIVSRLLYAGSDENIKNAAGRIAFDYLSKQQIFDLYSLYANLFDDFQSEASSESSGDYEYVRNHNKCSIDHYEYIEGYSSNSEEYISDSGSLCDSDDSSNDDSSYSSDFSGYSNDGEVKLIKSAEESDDYSC